MNISKYFNMYIVSVAKQKHCEEKLIENATTLGLQTSHIVVVLPGFVNDVLLSETIRGV